MNGKGLATAVVLSVALVGLGGCDTQPETDDELERAAEATERAVEEAGLRIAAAFDDVDVDADGAVDEEDWRGWWNEDGWFSDWDLNADGSLTENELGAGVRGEAFGEDFDAAVFSRWDGNDDDRLSDAELRDGLFAWMDANDDGRLDEDEWRLEVNI